MFSWIKKLFSRNPEPVFTITGRHPSKPNLQFIPMKTAQGRKVRAAFTEPVRRVVQDDTPVTPISWYDPMPSPTYESSPDCSPSYDSSPSDYGSCDTGSFDGGGGNSGGGGASGDF